MTAAVERGHAPVRSRVFTGSSGWGQGQLRGEVNRNMWYVSAPASVDFVMAGYSKGVKDELVDIDLVSSEVCDQGTAMWTGVMNAWGGEYKHFEKCL